MSILKNIMRYFFSRLFALMFSVAIFSSCEKSEMSSAEGGTKAVANNSGGSSSAPGSGVLTAGEWNDLENWGFWQNLMLNDTFKTSQKYWGFYCNQKWQFVVKDNNQLPVPDAKIIISSNNTLVWEGRTNKFGILNTLPGIFLETLPGNLSYKINYNNIDYNSGSISVTSPVININLPVAVTPATTVDLMFVVDATGSMGDEISYLKNELLDVLERSDKQLQGTLRFGSVFYRDKGDEYVTRINKFTSSKTEIVNFVNGQQANGGGDWPEAVEEALKEAMQQEWSSKAKARILFLILDAPPHNETQTLQLLRQQIKIAAANGIMIIPISASGIDKTTEFLLRFMSLATNSTYTFLTNDSGIGNEHITPTVGEYQVEFLNNLMVRLILKYGGN